MAILITGGCGYIGSHTCIELCKAGYEVVALDNFHNAKPKVIERISALSGKPLTFYTCDIRDARGLSAIFEAHTVEAVIHFAGWKAVGESTVLPLEYYENNVSGTVTLLKVMRKFGCKRIVFSSSATVYGEENPSPLTEDMPRMFAPLILIFAECCCGILIPSAPTKAAPSAKIPTGFPTI